MQKEVVEDVGDGGDGRSITLSSAPVPQRLSANLVYLVVAIEN